MEHSKIIAARRFMIGAPSYPETGAEICASCGYDTATLELAKAMSSSFNQMAFIINDSLYLCDKCLALFKGKEARSKCLLWTFPGERQILSREDILPLLKSPPKQYVLCVPYSFQKHIFFYAGISSNKCAYIGTDNRTVIIDYQKNDVPAIIDQVRQMLMEGVPRKEVETGTYSIFTLSKYGSMLDKWEDVLLPMRHDGAVELIVKYSPAVKNKTRKFYEREEMFTDSEKKAIRLLGALAEASAVRRNRPMEFWGGEFMRRIARYKEEKDLHLFFSKVAGQLQCGCQLDVSIIDELEDAESLLVMKDIRSKLEMLVAAVYTAHRESRDIKPTSKKTGVKNESLSFFD